ncbi:MAG: M20/M25/M40 family metallo-hydrolase [Alphaproteobacteria bacterium]|nr:M20/M25/M40 family metallo-hydrolase [Alphaproteobacteria bacterium]
MLGLLLPVALAADPAATLADMDWDAATEEVAHVLAHYLQADTTNPPGNETVGAQVLARVLAAEGIPSEIWEPEPGRGNLIARLPATAPDGEGALCLLSHLDVVTSEPERWHPDHPPLSGHIAPDDDGVLSVWGRGALDMKGLGAMELMTLVWLKRLGVPLSRDVVLIAVSDEEVYNTGAQMLAEQRLPELGCSHVLNEGGLGVEGALFEGQTLFPISVGEKGALWVRMVATGAPGHGSVPRPGEAPQRLIAAMNALNAYDPDPVFHPALVELLDAAGEAQGGAPGFVMTHPALARGLLRGTLMANPATRATLIDTVHITGMEGANEPNVVPSEVAALLDCRLLPDTTPEQMLARLEALVDDPEVRFEVISAQQGNVSAWRGDPLYDALARHIAATWPEAAVGPYVSVGFTDSIYLRPHGVQAFGMMPVSVPPELLETMHGDDERMPVEELGKGLRVVLSVVIEVAGAEDS